MKKPGESTPIRNWESGLVSLVSQTTGIVESGPTDNRNRSGPGGMSLLRDNCVSRRREQITPTSSNCTVTTKPHRLLKLGFSLNQGSASAERGEGRVLGLVSLKGQASEAKGRKNPMEKPGRLGSLVRRLC
ncbi:hypothetical protein EAI_05721 [Harpegnathos saltator]|uniref:Uncharacterized protein n=1 Tax=Harpegnathos saltator TaxID=610380 RepID=E2BMW2_HARSA|nr:hypothetical protein EAI_05721 [Harpegnathos saltator]